MKKFGLTKNDRIYLKNDFKLILEQGNKVYKDGIVLWCRPNPCAASDIDTKPPRIGIIVSKKLGNAPQRNRCKRLLREVFRLNRHLLTDGADCILSPRDTRKLKDYGCACAAFLALAEKAKILKSNKDL